MTGIINIQKNIFLKAAFISILGAVCVNGSANTRFEQAEVIKAGIRPLYTLVFSEYRNQYSDSPGFLAYARGGYQLNIDGTLLLYPEFSWGFIYTAHKSEKQRQLMLFPFTINIFFDAKALNFPTKAGTFVLKPYIGLGAYLDDYKSPRARAAGCDFGFQAGINLEYTHINMKNCYIEISIDHLLATNFKKTLPMLAFSVGAGYAFDMGKYKKAVPVEAEGEGNILPPDGGMVND